MRLRNIPGADKVIAESPYCIHNPEQNKSQWKEVFGNSNPIHIEIGMGKGQFIMSMAETHSDINYIGIERYTSVTLRAVQKMDAIVKEGKSLDNLRFLCFDAKNLAEIFSEGEVDRIYLNFSDPWPKDRHARRRLTSSTFLALYDKILRKDGQIEFKTDNVDLFDFSINEINESAVWEISEYTYDLHNEPSMNAGNIMTEYEEKFSSIGNPICKLICKRKTK